MVFGLPEADADFEIRKIAQLMAAVPFANPAARMAFPFVKESAQAAGPGKPDQRGHMLRHHDEPEALSFKPPQFLIQDAQHDPLRLIEREQFRRVGCEEESLAAKRRRFRGMFATRGTEDTKKDIEKWKRPSLKKGWASGSSFVSSVPFVAKNSFLPFASACAFSRLTLLSAMLGGIIPFEAVPSCDRCGIPSMSLWTGVAIIGPCPQTKSCIGMRSRTSTGPMRCCLAGRFKK